MTDPLRQQLIEWFQSYVQRFEDPPGILHPLLQIKVDHSRFVASDMRLLATKLQWSQSDIYTAEVIGWLHDVGRFMQFQEYHSFLDAKTINHAEASWQVLQEEAPLAACSPSARQCILCAIRHHNRRNLPDGLPSNHLRFLHLVRDADKLDIYRVVAEAVRDRSFERFPEMFPSLDLDGPVSPELVADFEQGNTVSYAHVRSMADLQLLQLAWVYQLNYAPSLALMQQRDIISAITANLPNDPFIEQVVTAAREFLDESHSQQGDPTHENCHSLR